MRLYSCKSMIRGAALGLSVLILIGCSGYNKIVKMPEVGAVPAGQYERIIKLTDFEGIPDKTLAGVIFIKKEASVCSDFPRQEILKSIDELTVVEKNHYRYFSNYSITTEGKALGFVSIPVEYITTLWVNEQDETCKYKVQVELASKERGDVGSQINRMDSGGGRGGFDGRGHGR